MIVKRALISVSDKQGIIEFAQGLQSLGIEIISTGGSAKLLSKNGINVIEISQYTGFPEMLDGRVKTLHPKVHAGLLAKRDDSNHLKTIAEHEIETIDLLCVNLYPFVATINKPNVSLEEAIENIDIGGPAMIRSSAKNYQGVAVVTEPSDYQIILNELINNSKQLSREFNFTLAKKAFTHTARYDSAIANWLTSLQADPHSEIKTSQFPDALHLSYNKVTELRYGENPHQSAAFYRAQEAPTNSIAAMQQLQGKELSFNNIADSDAAWTAVLSIAEPACVIVKHANPCGVASAPLSILTAYESAFKTDPTSAFGGIIAFNRLVDEQIINAMNERKHFVEVIIAPEYSEQALQMLAAKNNLRVLRLASTSTNLNNSKLNNELELKYVSGGILVQNRDDLLVDITDFKVVSKLNASQQQLEQLLFAWRVVKMVKSNAIVFCRDKMTLGIGAGQMSRVDSTRIAVSKAGLAGLDLQGSFVASDAFFPFRDGIDVLAAAGAKAVIQPGGSVRDNEVIEAADHHGLIMVFTGVRHFRH